MQTTATQRHVTPLDKLVLRRHLNTKRTKNNFRHKNKSKIYTNIRNLHASNSIDNLSDTPLTNSTTQLLSKGLKNVTTLKPTNNNTIYNSFLHYRHKMYSRYFFKESNNTTPNHQFKCKSQFTSPNPDNENLIEFTHILTTRIPNMTLNYSREEMALLICKTIKTLLLITRGYSQHTTHCISKGLAIHTLT